MWREERVRERKLTTEVQDLFVIALSSCARFLPSRRGYHYIAGSPNGRTRSQRDREAENRLIDQLDEEWDD